MSGRRALTIVNMDAYEAVKYGSENKSFTWVIAITRDRAQPHGERRLTLLG